MIQGLYLTFSWLPLQGITEYEFMLSDNPAMISPLADKYVESTAISVNISLEDGKTYFWQVRATQPARSDWSNLGTFTFFKTTETPPPLVVEEAPPGTAVISLTAPALPFLSMFTMDHLPLIIFIIVTSLLVVIALIILGPPPIRFFAFLSRQEGPAGPSRKTKAPGAEPTSPQVRPERRTEEVRPQARPETRAEIPPKPTTPEPATPHPSLMEKDKAGAAVIFAAKSFMWMVTQEEEAAEGQTGLPEKERQSLGKKVATKIHDLAKKENLYIKYPEDAPMLLGIWAQYGSINETSNYLIKSFESKPDNAIELLKCYLPAALPGREPSADAFTMAQYASIAEIIDPGLIYAALTKIFKFKTDTIEEKMPVKPADRNLAFQFMRLHFKAKGVA
jgi:hypothetical protein